MIVASRRCFICCWQNGHSNDGAYISSSAIRTASSQDGQLISIFFHQKSTPQDFNINTIINIMLNGLRNITFNIYTPLSSGGILAYAAQINEPKKTTIKIMAIAVYMYSPIIRMKY
jgi:hypothetical protein